MTNRKPPGRTFVLVHGSWHGSWCWDKVVSLLQRAGHNAVVLDLPGRAGDATPPRELSLSDYTDKVCRVLDLQPEPVVLVGHSMGGMVVTQTAEYRPEKIQTLVYLCGFLLENGQSLWDFYGQGEHGLTMNFVEQDEAAGVLRFREDAPLRQIFYHDCSEADYARARAMLVPEPMRPRMVPVSTSAEHYGQVRRVYIETLQDQSIPNALQKKMIAAQPCERVLALDTGHSPFLSAPVALANHLLSIAGV